MVAKGVDCTLDSILHVVNPWESERGRQQRIDTPGRHNPPDENPQNITVAAQTQIVDQASAVHLDIEHLRMRTHCCHRHLDYHCIGGHLAAAAYQVVIAKAHAADCMKTGRLHQLVCQQVKHSFHQR